MYLFLLSYSFLRIILIYNIYNLIHKSYYHQQRSLKQLKIIIL